MSGDGWPVIDGRKATNKSIARDTASSNAPVTTIAFRHRFDFGTISEIDSFTAATTDTTTSTMIEKTRPRIIGTPRGI